jgi:hypothetical protein
MQNTCYCNHKTDPKGGKWRCTKDTIMKFLIIMLLVLQLRTGLNLMDSYTFATTTKPDKNTTNDAATQGSDSGLTFTNDQLEKLCNVTNEIVHKTHGESMQSQEERWYWTQTLPFFLLTCQELARSLHTTTSSISSHVSTTGVTANNEDSRSSTTEEDEEDSRPLASIVLDNNLSFQRLAEKLQKLPPFIGNPTAEDSNSSHHQRPLKIIAIGGSMSTGFVDIARNDTLFPRSIAWPRKLELFMHQQWGNQSVQIINLAEGGADENSWIARLDVLMSHAPFDIVLVESAVNDQCSAKKQISKAKEVDYLSHILLNTLTKFPNDPAVVSVELFRLAFTNRRDANKQCPDEVQEIRDGTNNNQTCLYCSQWWKPQDWRKEARERNSVSYVSYRDAVWPVLDQPPANLCQYWPGLSHPQAGTHALVASTILFQFMAVLEKRDALLELAMDVDNNKITLDDATPVNVCLNPISSFRAMLEDPNDPMQLEAQAQMQNRSSCWTFRADVRQKYGWICQESKQSTTAWLFNATKSTSISSNVSEQDYLHLRKELRIGGDGKVIISRLVSYDERMAVAQAWFSHTVKHPNGTTTTEENVFVGDPVWKVTSWDRPRLSIPQPEVILLSGYNFTKASQMSWKSGESLAATTTLVTFNMRLLLNSSPASKKDEMNGIDKFKLLGVVTC